MNQNTTKSIVGILSFSLAASCFAFNNGVAVRALPEPDGDGAYVFGNDSYNAGDPVSKRVTSSG